MRFTARVPYLGDEIEVYVPLWLNGAIWLLFVLAHFNNDCARWFYY